ncbi:tetratricopeptide repeat protein [Paenibacillus sp. M1]|uniref:Tetratricopeptide repeat protein n=1 Tax=Paenibacillus haidiansis TaxID=1574488 RepID=A0ABU7VKM7_9BACL
MMFQHMFAEMNEMLDDIIKFYHVAQGAEKQDLAKKWHLLKTMSDGIIEEWLNFEEKMGAFRQSLADSEGKESYELPEMKCDAFVKGQGYYKLLMFTESLTKFRLALEEFPDSLVTRTYLAMCLMHLEQYEEAIPHFWRVLEDADNRRLRSIIYNALGCIEAHHGGRDKAKEYFKLAHYHDPSLAEPLANLEACMRSSGKLQYGNELTSLL